MNRLGGPKTNQNVLMVFNLCASNSDDPFTWNVLNIEYDRVLQGLQSAKDDAVAMRGLRCEQEITVIRQLSLSVTCTNSTADFFYFSLD